MRRLALACLAIPMVAHAQARTPSVLILSSSTWTQNAAIPSRSVHDGGHCHGGNLSPALSWSGVPLGASSLLVTIRDPDAPGGVFWHWILADIPRRTTHLAEGTTGIGTPFPSDWGDRAYGGPCPPQGQSHRYVVTIQALDLATLPPVPVGSLAGEVAGHVLESASLVARYP